VNGDWTATADSQNALSSLSRIGTATTITTATGQKALTSLAVAPADILASLG